MNDSPDFQKSRIQEEGRALAAKLRAELDDDLMFAVFVFRDDGSASYVSDAPDFAVVMGVVERWERQVTGTRFRSPSSDEAAALRKIRNYLVSAEQQDCEVEPPDAIAEAVIKWIRFLRHRYRSDVPDGRRNLR